MKQYVKLKTKKFMVFLVKSFTLKVPIWKYFFSNFEIS